MSISEIIAQTRAAYNARGISDHDIGNGWCAHFASDVLTQFLGEDWVHLENENCMTVETGSFCKHDEHGFPSEWDPDVLRHFQTTVPVGVTQEKLAEVGSDCPHHVWIFYNGKHYDAESPDGESSFLNLKFFQRHLAIL